MRHTNGEMQQMLESLRPLLERRDIIGYAAARNSRILRVELTEFLERRDELVMKYGEADVDEEGNPTGQVSLKMTSPNLPAFANELQRYSSITHEFEPFRIKYDEAIGQLSGTELLSVEWMFED